MGNGTKIGLVLVLVLIVVVCLNVYDGTGPDELSDPETGKGGSAAVEKKDPRVAANRNTANGSTSNGSTSNGARGGTQENTVRPNGAPKRNETAQPTRDSSRTNSSVSYDAGRDRRLAGDRRMNGSTPPVTPSTGDGSRTSSLPITGRPAGSDRSRTNPDRRDEGTRFGSSPTGVGSPVRPPANGTPAGSNVGNTSTTDPKSETSNAGSTGTVRPAVTPGGRSANGTPTPATGSDPKGGTEPKTDRPPAIIGRKPGEGSSTRNVPPRKPEETAKKETAPAAGNSSLGPSSSGTWPKTHQIIEGDSLWELAGHYYQKKTLFTHILENNPQLGDGAELRVGDRLTIPAPPRAVAKKPTAGSPSESARAIKPGFQTYTILDGDTLYDIAEDKLGSGLRWTEIQSANPGLDPARLKVGEKIQVPTS